MATELFFRQNWRSCRWVTSYHPSPSIHSGTNHCQQTLLISTLRNSIGYWPLMESFFVTKLEMTLNFRSKYRYIKVVIFSTNLNLSESSLDCKLCFQQKLKMYYFWRQLKNIVLINYMTSWNSNIHWSVRTCLTSYDSELVITILNLLISIF